MRRQRQVLEDETHPAGVFLEDLVQRPLDAAAEGSLVVGELDDGDPGVERALHHARVDRHVDLRARGPGVLGPPPREDQQQPDREAAGEETAAVPAAQTRAPSSAIAVMM
jgi:hypothetical protein